MGAVGHNTGGLIGLLGLLDLPLDLEVPLVPRELVKASPLVPEVPALLEFPLGLLGLFGLLGLLGLPLDLEVPLVPRELVKASPLVPEVPALLEFPLGLVVGERGLLPVLFSLIVTVTELGFGGLGILGFGLLGDLGLSGD